jgi:hypothetical protein
MRIQFEHRGGLTDVRIVYVGSVDALSVEEQQKLTSLVDHSGFFDLPSKIDGDGGADRFDYAITIDSGSRTHTVRVNERTMPACLRPLVAWLTMAAGRD